jgi:hypothetical protein
MSSEADADLAPSERVKDIPRAQAALRRAVEEALWHHKLIGAPVVVWRDGKVMWIPPEEIPTPPWVAEQR